MPDQAKFLIWSYRNRQWWKPEQAGYTLDTKQAGRYDFNEAADIVLHQGLPGSKVAISEAMVDRLPNEYGKSEPKDVEAELQLWRVL